MLPLLTEKKNPQIRYDHNTLFAWRLQKHFDIISHLSSPRVVAHWQRKKDYVQQIAKANISALHCLMSITTKWCSA